MTRRMPRAIAFVLAFSLAATSSAIIPASAAPATKPLAESLSGDAQAAYEAGKRVYALGDYAAAGAKFKYAYDLSKDVRLLWNYAACERAQLHYARAFNILEQYTREGADTLTAQNLSDAAATKAALQEFYSLVTIAIEPTGAHVLVDGTDIGTAPLNGPFAVDVGTHAVRVEAKGFEPFEKKLEVPGKTTIKLDVKLTSLGSADAASGQLHVKASEGDTIAIDGKVAGVGSYDGTLPIGSHVVRITAPGKKLYETQLQVSSGAPRTLEVTLESESSGVPTWLWITGGVVVAGGLAAGSYFLFKPKDEPGSSPSGKLDTFVLKAFRPISF